MTGLLIAAIFAFSPVLPAADADDPKPGLDGALAPAPEATKPQPPSAGEMIDGWIVGANGKVLRVDLDGTQETIHSVPGLRYLRVVPGTGMVVVGSDSGVELYDGKKWHDICQGPWEQIDYSMNYRTANVLESVNGQRQVDIIQLSPEVRSLESYVLPRDQQCLLGYRWNPLRQFTMIGGMPDPISRTAVWALPSAKGELAFRSQYYMYGPDGPAVAVWVTVYGEMLPVEFVATSDATPTAYATVMTSPGEGYLLGLNMQELRAKVKDRAVLGEAPKPTLEVTLDDASRLVKLDAPVDRVIPCPAPYLCYLSAGRLIAVNTTDGQVDVVRRNMEGLEPFRWDDSRLGYLWYVESVKPCRLLVVAPAKQFSEMAMDTAFRMVSVNENPALSPLGPDIIGMVGFGPYRWPRPLQEAVAESPGPPGGKLEGIAVHPVEGTRPEAIIFVKNRTYAAVADGSLEEWRGSLFRANGDYQLSADRKVLLANAGADTMGWPQGPLAAFRPDGAIIHPDGGALSADGRRLWLHPSPASAMPASASAAVEAYDTTSGVLRLLLQYPASDQRVASPKSGPEFATLLIGSQIGFQGQLNADGYLGSEAWLVADEPQQTWVKTLPVGVGMDRGQGGLHGYADRTSSSGVLTLWRGPHGGALVVERLGEVSTRVYMLTPDRFSAWTQDAQTMAKGLMVASGWPLDPFIDASFSDAPLYDVRAMGGPIGGGMGGAIFGGPTTWTLGYMLREASWFNARWSRTGSRALLEFGSKTATNRFRRVVLVSEDGSTLLLPDTYSFVDFATDGESLLAVISLELIEPTAPAGQQVLVKMDLGASKVTWVSQPFAGCQGMVPYPAFDLREFHDGPAVGQR